jgi:hypothetical protein
MIKCGELRRSEEVVVAYFNILTGEKLKKQRKCRVTGTTHSGVCAILVNGDRLKLAQLALLNHKHAETDGVSSRFMCSQPFSCMSHSNITHSVHVKKKKRTPYVNNTYIHRSVRPLPNIRN